MTKTTYTATFTTGETITRKSDRAYGFAWAVINNETGQIEEKGFSADRAKAAKAAGATGLRPVSARERRDQRLRRFYAEIAREKGFANKEELFAARDADCAAYHAKRRTEIVAAVAQ